MNKIPVIVLLTLFWFGCEESISPSCSLELNTTLVSVFYSDDSPADSVSIKTVFSETGEEFDACLQTFDSDCCDAQLSANSYIIMTDKLLDKISPSGTSVTVTGTKNELSFSKVFVFEDDGCHVQLKSGDLRATLTLN